MRYACLCDACLHFAYLRDAFLLDACLRYAYMRDAFLRYDYFQDRLVGIQLWIDVFMISMILFQLLRIEYRATSSLVF